MDGKISVIMAVYNREKTVDKAIQSILDQTYTNWELIIVDDCSTDNTDEVMAEFLSDSRIVYMKNKTNSGAAVSRNRALQVAKGKWIAFLDSDDLWHPEKLEKQISFMEDNQYDFSYTDYSEIDESDLPLGKLVTGPKKITKCGMYAYCWPGCLTVMYNAEKVGLIQIEPIRKNNDYAMWLKVIEKASCYCLKQTLAYYRKRTGSISNHSYTKLIKWHYRLFKEANGNSAIASVFLTIGNLCWGVFKKLYYVRRIDK